jgi:RNA polymerase sigma factor (sigma-70 family)
MTLSLGTDERSLIRQYAITRDAGVFAELARRYAGLVYGTSLRITRNTSDAEDVTQECFLQLAQEAASVKQSLPGWLHAAARSRSLNLVRGQARRQRHEAQAPPPEPSDPASLARWQEIAQVIDEAIAELPDELREPIILHYLQGQSQPQVAAALGTSQPTISRRLREAVEVLRGRLERSGVALPAVVVADELAQHALVEAPASLVGELGKMAIAGVGHAAAPVAGTKALAAAAVLVVIAGGAWWLLRGPDGSRTTPGDTPMSHPTQTAGDSQAAATIASGVPGAFALALPATQRQTWVEGFTAPGGLRPLMQVIGDPSGFATAGDWYSTEIFPLFMGVCGDAFSFVWYREDGSPRQQSDSYILSSPAEQYLPALAAAGFDGRVIFDPKLARGAPDAAWDAETLRREVVSSLARRSWPVLIVGLPEPGWNAVITGYEDGGRTLIGWSEPGWESFGFRFEAVKQQKFTDWFAKAGGVVLLTAQHARPPEEDVLRSALERAVPLLTRRSVGNLVAGPATYEELAKRLADPTLDGNDAATAKRRDALLFPMIWDLATQRHYASPFLERAAVVLPSAADDLNAAADLFTAIHDAVWEINRRGGGTDPGSPLPNLADTAVRQQVAQIILRCRDHDLEAANRIEAALRKLD